jgi:hypothetical protein
VAVAVAVAVLEAAAVSPRGLEASLRTPPYVDIILRCSSDCSICIVCALLLSLCCLGFGSVPGLFGRGFSGELVAAAGEVLTEELWTTTVGAGSAAAPLRSRVDHTQ